MSYRMLCLSLRGKWHHSWLQPTRSSVFRSDPTNSVCQIQGFTNLFSLIPNSLAGKIENKTNQNRRGLPAFYCQLAWVVRFVLHGFSLYTIVLHIYTDTSVLTPRQRFPVCTEIVAEAFLYNATYTILYIIILFLMWSLDVSWNTVQSTYTYLQCCP